MKNKDQKNVKAKSSSSRHEKTTGKGNSLVASIRMKLDSSPFLKRIRDFWYADTKPMRLVRRLTNVVLFGVGLYFILMPLVPEFTFYMQQLKGEVTYEAHHTSDMDSRVATVFGDENEDGIPDGNVLVVPAIGIEVEIVEGSDDSALEYGAWRRPNTSTPPEGGNTVLTGHRFRYLPPNNLTFYHLDKVEIGDEVIVYWEGKRYDYEVSDVFVVEPTQIEVEANTASPRVTLYTCTPLWTAKQRLVVVAEPVAEEGGQSEGADGESVNLEEL